MSDPFAPPAPRLSSLAPLVDTLRPEVDAWRADGYPGASATTKRLLEFWFFDEHQTDDGLPFRYYFAQREAVETVVYLYEVAKRRTLAELVAVYAQHPVPVQKQRYPRYVVKAATGSGKTKVMALLVAWSYFHARYEPDSELTTTSLIIAPNLIVLERLKTDFENGATFRTDPIVPPEWRADFDLRVCIRDEPIPVGATGVLALTNIQALYEYRAAEPANPVEAMLGGAPPKKPFGPEPLLEQIARRGRVLVVNDEAHHLHDSIARETGAPLTIWQTLFRLHELTGNQVCAQLDFSATPRNQEGRIFDDVVVDYPLAQAIDDGIVKRPVIGELGGAVTITSDDAAVRFGQQIGAGVAKWREFRDRLADIDRRPLLFVMAEDTRAADQVEGHLNTLPDLAGRVLNIHVNMGGRNKGEIAKDDLEKARAAARTVDDPDSPYSAIVSVLMLREGWDVRNVTVIVPLRPFTASAKILPEQTLGRGLRRMTPPGSGADEQLVIIEHEAFRSLWDSVLDDEGIGGIERRPAGEVHPDPVVVTVEPERLDYDIEIPQLPRLLNRTSTALTTLRPVDVPRRSIRLPDELHSDIVDYTGRDLRTGEVIEHAEYPLPVADQPEPVIAWFANELASRTHTVGQFAVLAPLVKGYLEERAFDGPVDVGDPLVLQALREPAARQQVIAPLEAAILERTLTTALQETPVKPLLLSRTRPFLWSHQSVVVGKSVFSRQPCDSGLEMRFCEFLDRASDVESFAKLAPPARFSLEYRAEGGRLAYYYPDFVVRGIDGSHWLLETKGLVDPTVPLKDERATRWATEATSLTGTRWTYLRIDQAPFEENIAALGTLVQLVDLVREVRRSELLGSLPAPRRRERTEILEAMRRVEDGMRGVTGIDEAVNRFRNDLDG